MGRTRSFIAHDPIWRVPVAATPTRPNVMARWHRRHRPMTCLELAAVANMTGGSASDRRARLPPRCTP